MEAGDYDPRIRILLCRMHRLESWSLPNLSAPHWRLYWNTAPGASVVLDGRETRLVPARCMVIPPNTPYAARLARPVTHFYLHFLAAPPYDAVAPEIFTFQAPPAILAAIREASELLAPLAAPGPQLAVLCHHLASWALSRLPAEKALVHRTDERVAAALRRMEENFSSPPGNADFAERAGMNVNAFIRLFRKTTGQSPQACFTAKRIERACLFLHGSALSIKAIAATTGFCDRYHFSRVFKRLRGVGPAEFRRRSY